MQHLSTEEDGNNGAFLIPTITASHRDNLKVIASDGLGWEHVSVSKNYECPSWDDMCRIKELFWDAEDLIVQFHPPKSNYVNNHPYCLHLWRPIEQKIPTPDTIMV